MGPGLPYCCLFPDISVKIMNPKYLASLTKKIDKISLTSWKDSAMQIRDSEREKKKPYLPEIRKI